MSDTEIPESHPGYQSFPTRHRIEGGVERGTTSRQGPIVQGRDGTFDYFFGERMLPSSDETTQTAVAHLLLTDQPVISVNRNVTALCPSEVVDLAAAVDADIEVSPFNRTDEHVWAIAAHLHDHGADEVKGFTGDGRIPGIDHEHARVDVDGIGSADVVVVPLEDGDWVEVFGVIDRVEIVIDLNPMSWSVQVVTVSTVNNIMHAVPNTATHARDPQDSGVTREGLETTAAGLSADVALDAVEQAIHADDE